MRTPLAVCNLIHNKPRTAVATAGVAFAVILVFMQLGFRAATEQTATLVYEQLEFDLLLRSPSYEHLCDARFLPRNRLYQVSSLPGVKSVVPFYVGIQEWQSPTDGAYSNIMAMGIDPDHHPFRHAEIERNAGKLGKAEFLMIDRKSKQEFGPANWERFGDEDVGVTGLLGWQLVKIIDHFEMGTGFAANGAVLISAEGFCQCSGFQTLEDVNLGLIRLAEGVDPEETRRQIEALLQPYPDVEVWNRKTALDFEKSRWVNDTSIGVIFNMGVVVSILVGTVIVYQVLATDVANLLGEYATLKAMGYRDAFLVRVIVEQAAALAVLGFAVGLPVSMYLYLALGGRAEIPLEMTSTRGAVVFGLTLFMCCFSGLVAVRKLSVADPADLF